MPNLEIKKLNVLTNKFKENYIDEYYAKKELYDYYRTFWDNNSWFYIFWCYIFSHELFVELRNTYKNWDSTIDAWNKEYIKNELQKNEGFFKNILGYKFDEQQKLAVVKDDTYNLVLAGAGCGKTLTIAGKIKYLVEKKNINPDSILLLAFTKKAAEEMSSRINKKMGINVKASTFHALGYSILKDVEQKDVDVVDSIDDFIGQYFLNDIDKNEEAKEEILNFISLYLNYNVVKDADSYKKEKLVKREDLFELKVECEMACLDKATKKESSTSKNSELDQNIRDKEKQQETIKGEKVRSRQEARIANFLFLNGINYIYEHPYPHDEKDNYRKNYRPDFYLADYDIYWEHFGVNKNFRAPWLDEKDEGKYLEGIEWKRKIHNANNTKLIESYSYMFDDESFEEHLYDILRRNEIKTKKVNISKIYDEVFVKKKSPDMENFWKLISTFLNLVKTNGFDDEWFEKIICTRQDITSRDKYFLAIAKKIYIKYEEYLANNKFIDFNDMINKATDYIKNDCWKSNYKYIIVDEYQDISSGRYNLLKAIADKNKAKLFCVGDDWQSIYRFTGSDISLMSKFEEFWGKNTLTRIEKSYRNASELLEISEKFILKNDFQLPKKVISDNKVKEPVICYTYENDSSSKYSVSHVIYRTFEKINDLCGNRKATVMLLGRNNHDLKYLLKCIENDDKPISKGKKDGNSQVVFFEQFPNLKINFLTVHAAKGLESDYVVLINMRNAIDGFPNQIVDDRVLRLVLNDMDEYEYAEERRLFYVALTRTKNSVFLLAPRTAESCFFTEVAKENNIEIIGEKTVGCRRCEEGYLVIRKTKKGSFLGCSNYPDCDFTVPNISVLENPRPCKKCDGYMLKRTGPYGDFAGCSNFPDCFYKENIASFYLNYKK